MYILILVYLTGFGPRLVVTTQEFSSQASCAAASEVIYKGFVRNDDANSLKAMSCVKK